MLVTVFVAGLFGDHPASFFRSYPKGLDLQISETTSEENRPKNAPKNQALNTCFYFANYYYRVAVIPNSENNGE